MFKKIIKLFVIIMFIFVFSACGSKVDDTERTGVAYGITHKDYVGVATVKVKAGLVTAASFEEYYLPNTWAKVKNLDTEEIPVDIVADGATWYGKYLVIGNKKFTGELRENPLVINEVTYSKQTIRYYSDDIEDLYIWLAQKEENRKWYVEQLEADKAYVADAGFNKSERETAGSLKSDGKLGFTKSETNYWSGENYTLGWQGNMDEIVKAIKGTKMNVTLDNIKMNDDNKWVIGDVVSGATLVDFKDYYIIAQTAYNKALPNK